MNPSDENTPKIKVCLVEDHHATRESFIKLLRHAEAIVCVGACSDGNEALAKIPQLSPDVVLMDINLPGHSGIECVRTLKQHHPQIEFVMLTTYDDTDLILDALRAGASGYLLKRTAPEEWVDAIKDGPPRRLAHVDGNRAAGRLPFPPHPPTFTGGRQAQ